MEREAYLTAFRNRDTTTSFDELQKRIIDFALWRQQLWLGRSGETE